jgi:hypothetical protein
MYDSNMTERPAGLEMRWVPVTDERGYTRMQAVWIDATPATSAITHHAA